MLKQAKNIPYHLGIIMDGNRRWAKNKNLPSLEGHRRGYQKIKEVGKWCKKKGIKILTVWAFSTENWNRSEKEVDYLMKLLGRALSKKETAWLNKEGTKLQVIGQKERLNKKLQIAVEKAEEATKNNKEGVLNLAISYGGRPEIIETIRKIIKKKVPPDEITEDLVNQNLWTKGTPDPDLIIRTSGELRLSGFLIWQAAYSELYFCKKYWPDFDENDLDAILTDYAQRQRRFGK